MRKLPTGITGFVSEIAQKKDAVSFEEFTADMSVLARGMEATIERCNPILTCENYFSCEMNWEHRKISILCNTVYPILACCEGFVSEERSNHFLFVEPFENTVSALHRYQVYPVEFLNAAIEGVIIDQLSHMELSQINHWRPQTVHEVVFNFWD